MTEQQIALETLKAAADAFYNALYTFRGTFDPDTVGIDEMVEHISDSICEIECEMVEEDDE